MSRDLLGRIIAAGCVRSTIAEPPVFPGPSLAAPCPAEKRDEVVLLRVRVVLEFLEQLLRDLILPPGLLVVVCWVHYPDNSKPSGRTRLHAFAEGACYDL